jgi:hypothetical protein
MKRKCNISAEYQGAYSSKLKKENGGMKNA